MHNVYNEINDVEYWLITMTIIMITRVLSACPLILPLYITVMLYEYECPLSTFLNKHLLCCGVLGSRHQS